MFSMGGVTVLMLIATDSHCVWFSLMFSNDEESLWSLPVNVQGLSLFFGGGDGLGMHI